MRIQRAARRRRANAVDSEAWYAELVRRRRQRQRAVPEPPDRPPVPLLEEDVNYWLRSLAENRRRARRPKTAPAESPMTTTITPFRPIMGRTWKSRRSACEMCHFVTL